MHRGVPLAVVVQHPLRDREPD
eukprot:COSAG02_NODE_82880_length_102_cov_3.000000_1_plen_21_part_01